MINLGADVVFGDHPHVVQDTEAYRGRLIVYNLGNLIYDQWFDQEVTKSLIVNIYFSTKFDSNAQAHSQLAENCSKFKDDCLTTAQNQALHKPILRYGYRIKAGNSSDVSLNERLKHLGDPATQKWLLNRTNWLQTTNELK